MNLSSNRVLNFLLLADQYMYTNSEQQFKPYFNKFNEVVTRIQTDEKKRTEKMMRDYAKTKFPKGCPPFLKLAEAYVHLTRHEYEKALAIAREIETTKPTEHIVCYNIIYIMKQCNLGEELLEIYKRLHERHTKETEVLKKIIIQQITLSHFAEAQTTVMQLIRNENSAENMLLAGTCSYFRAKAENSVIFYKMAVMFFDRSKILCQDIIEIKVDCLLAQGLYNEAIAFLQNAECEEKMSHDPISRIRTEMKIYEVQNQFDKVGELAVKFLNTINADSIDEWKLAVKYYPQVEALIQEKIESTKGKFRGPQLAKIELYKEKGQDITPLILEYANKYSGKPFLFGDIRPFLSPEIFSGLKGITDPALHCYINNSYPGEPTDERTTAMFAQSLLIKNDKTSFRQACDICAKYPKHPDTRIMLIILAGHLNATVAQLQLWTEQKLEAINYLSLGCFYLNSCINAWDFDSLKKLLSSTESFAFKGYVSFASNIDAAYNNFNFRAMEMANQFRGQLEQNMMLYCAHVVNMWLKFIDSVDEITAFKAEKLISLEKLDQLEIKVDDSVLPQYFNDPKLVELMFPSIKSVTQIFSTVNRVLIALKQNSKDMDSLLDELQSIAGNTAWSSFVQYVKSNETTLDFGSTKPDIYVIGSIALVNSITKKGSNFNNQLKDLLNSASEQVESSIEINQFPELFKPTAEEQSNRIKDAVAKVQALLA